MNMLVIDVLAHSPAAADAFIERGMGCVGCPFARFETVAEAAGVYGLEARDLAEALAAACASRSERLSTTNAVDTSR